MTADPLFFGGEIFCRRGYPKTHPLGIARVAAVIDLCERLDWLPAGRYVESPMASEAELARFHDPAYIAALRRAQRDKRVPVEIRERYAIGTLENPWFETVYDRAAFCCGGAIAAARHVAAGGTAYYPAGGTHHGRRDRASGFCYFNDPVLAIYALLDAGLGRVFYADIDGHHGDGVELAFAGDPRVFMVSVHEAGRWPNTGGLADRAGGNARNLPVPAGFNDSEMDLAIDEAFLPLARRFAPDAVVVTCGADALAEDPLTRLSLSNGALWRAVARLAGLAPRTLILGGGGYNPWATARCWAGVWATLNRYPIPDRLPPAAEEVLRGLDWNFEDLEDEGRPERWFTTLADPPRPGPVRDPVRAAVAAVLLA
ncbi:MAG: acetoin utilization protein AcuC [Rhodospirillales bacterium]|nr:acetoin utilization protein AcuC [Rhodospirillales bacterium]